MQAQMKARNERRLLHKLCMFQMKKQNKRRRLKVLKRKKKDFLNVINEKSSHLLNKTILFERWVVQLECKNEKLIAKVLKLWKFLDREVLEMSISFKEYLLLERNPLKILLLVNYTQWRYFQNRKSFHIIWSDTHLQNEK